MVIEDDQTVGIFTERHYARNVFLKGKSSPTTPVCDVMAVRPLFALPKQTVKECMAIMTKHRIRHLPVMDDEKFIIAQLEHYNRG